MVPCVDLSYEISGRTKEVRVASPEMVVGAGYASTVLDVFELHSRTALLCSPYLHDHSWPLVILRDR